MENQIVCPSCRKTILNNEIINEAIKGEGSTTRSFSCDCGEKITYWQVTAQLRDQKTLGRDSRNGFERFSPAEGKDYAIFPPQFHSTL